MFRPSRNHAEVLQECGRSQFCSPSITPANTRWSPRVLALGMIALLFASLAPAIAATPVAQPEVKVRDGRLTVNTHAAPLSEVLKAIAQQAGIKLTVWGNPGSVSVGGFVDVPLVDGIQRLVAATGSSLLMEFSDGDNLSALRVEAVWVMGPPASTDAGQPERTADDQKQIQLGVLAWDYDNGEAALPNYHSRITTIRELAGQCDHDGTIALLHVLTSDPEPQVRRALIKSLADLPSGSSCGLIEQGLLDEDAAVRIETLRAKAQAQGDEGFPTDVFISVFENDMDADVRAFAMQMLNTHDPAAARQVSSTNGSREPQENRTPQ